tara:strand:- start:935 stop:1696 length:762 start_codon:yes stop_codon:yes gene_type:complete
MSEDFSEAKESFDNDGFAVIRNFLSPDETEDVQANVARYIAEIVPRIPREHAFYEDKDDPETLKQLPRMEEYDDYFESLLHGSKFERLSEVLLDGPVLGRNLQYLRKPARVGLPTPPHQDGYYFNVTPCEGLTAWFSLGHADEENGCLRYIRGSHKKGLRPHARTQTLGFSQGITDFGQPDDLENEVAFTAGPGDLLVHHAVTVHRADDNPSETRDRPAIGFVYLSERAKEDREAVEAYRKKLAEDLASQGKI